MKTYVIIDVTYDYHRFQENLGVAHTLEDAWLLAYKFAVEENRGGLPIIDSKAQSLACDKPERHHIYIEEWQ